MPIVFIKGDLFEGQNIQALAHGCNCAGAMGKGIAVEFRERFPKMYQEYKTRCLSGQFKLGEVLPWTENGVTIFNLGTQKTWRTKAEVDAIERAAKKMVVLAEAMGINNIRLPRIGAGLGGLPWETVRLILTEIGAATTVELRIFEREQKQ